MAPIQPGII